MIEQKILWEKKEKMLVTSIFSFSHSVFQSLRYEQFLLFQQCFQKACFLGASKGVIVWEWFNEREFTTYSRHSSINIQKITITRTMLYFLEKLQNLSRGCLLSPCEYSVMNQNKQREDICWQIPQGKYSYLHIFQVGVSSIVWDTINMILHHLFSIFLGLVKFLVLFS